MDDVAQEIRTYEQLVHFMQGTPVLKRETCTDLLRQRVRVSFDFEITCNDEPIRNSRDDETEKQYNLALLRSFLTADKTKLLHMMVDAIGTEIGMNSNETFMETFLPEIDINSHVLFSEAIDGLSGDAGEYWREARDDSNLSWGDILTLSTEKLFACFNAEFVSSSYGMIGE